mmetsp:Transcript_41075/g.66558  ORF Transcript_41075/g.66558 Transcript_41075/m.66558 type:complete len:225 (+) Transcript_41075:37-711(+)
MTLVSQLANGNGLVTSGQSGLRRGTHRVEGTAPAVGGSGRTARSPRRSGASSTMRTMPIDRLSASPTVRPPVVPCRRGAATPPPGAGHPAKPHPRGTPRFARPSRRPPPRDGTRGPPGAGGPHPARTTRPNGRARLPVPRAAPPRGAPRSKPRKARIPTSAASRCTRTCRRNWTNCSRPGGCTARIWTSSRSKTWGSSPRGTLPSSSRRSPKRTSTASITRMAS